MNKNLKIAIEAAVAAGKVIMEIYESKNFDVQTKEDNSPLTLADKKANEVINKFLLPTNIPLISEENKQIDYSIRKQWQECWIVDPLDGTKEFIKRNGEFTVNIALVSGGKPQLGVIFAPALNSLYFANVSEDRAFKVSLAPNDVRIENILDKAEEISPSGHENSIRIVGSRSHMNDDTLQYIEELKRKYGKEIEVVSKGSSLKFCLVAEGEAHIYPRFAPTMEWDTVAGQAICEAVGLNCISRETGRPMTYNRENLLNGHFFVSYEG
ncbi:3'(2'),5'-bisphosphate nucleotidase CysQ [Salinimicrobium sp. TH3]|uniref:3'(2'),5'-bisphosphate nucleotidase CysQ n=1 Tax=Salinimicrobium sp. TH3 TaxID=2997342 RepID=UPI002274E8DB|nr:3'(2'),5'-bisphosphate nucleotidase CysQ [Salinimicrobium sp. TH3]MCY2686941.1 3'(2'),5'-bisphosphate nucleotidase CysQ [Salinimicrobium sp. TH3]